MPVTYIPAEPNRDREALQQLGQTFAQIAMAREQSKVQKEQLRLQRERLEMEQAQEARAAAQQQAVLAQQQAARQAQEQGALTNLNAFLANVTSGDPASQAALQQLPEVRGSLAMQAAGTMLGTSTRPNAAALASASRPSAGQPSRIEEQVNAAASQQAHRALINSFPEAQRPGVERLLALRAYDLPAEILGHMEQRMVDEGVLAETAVARLDRLQEEQALAEARQRYASFSRAENTRQQVAALVSPEGMNLESVPDAVVNDFLRNMNPAAFTSPQEQGFQLLKSLLTQTVVGFDNVPRPSFSVEEAGVRAEQGLQMMYPGARLQLSESQRGIAGFVQDAVAALTTNASLPRGEQRSNEEIRQEILSSYTGLIGNFADGSSITQADLARALAEAVQKVGIAGRIIE